MIDQRVNATRTLRGVTIGGVLWLQSIAVYTALTTYNPLETVLGSQTSGQFALVFTLLLMTAGFAALVRATDLGPGCWVVAAATFVLAFAVPFALFADEYEFEEFLKYDVGLHAWWIGGCIALVCFFIARAGIAVVIPNVLPLKCASAAMVTDACCQWCFGSMTTA